MSHKSGFDLADKNKEFLWSNIKYYYCMEIVDELFVNIVTEG
jgi:hypothetical protein